MELYNDYGSAISIVTMSGVAIVPAGGRTQISDDGPLRWTELEWEGNPGKLSLPTLAVRASERFDRYCLNFAGVQASTMAGGGGGRLYVLVLKPNGGLYVADKSLTEAVPRTQQTGKFPLFPSPKRYACGLLPGS